MKKVTLVITAELCTVLGITDSASEVEVAGAIKRVVDENKTLGGKVATLETQIKNEAVTAKADQVKKLLDEALTAKKITNELRTIYEGQYKENPEGLKAVLDAMPAHVSIVDAVARIDRGNDAEYKLFETMPWDELDKKGHLKALKEKFNDLYIAKYKAQFGYEPNTKPVPPR